MTRNQIDWQNMLIAKSRASEEARHNLVNERLQSDAQSEARRSNMARESIQLKQADTEFAKLQEAIRNNDVVNYLNRLRNDETVRSNLANEANQRLNISTTHLDRAEANKITKDWNQVQKSIKNLELLTNKNLKKQELLNQAEKIANDYEIAKGNLLVNEINARSNQLTAASKVAQTFMEPIKTVTQILKK